jgi:hypothetical protein
MPTVYIQPGTGTGSGTASDPYYYSELGSAETAAGDGGTILFTDGTYSLSGTITWDAGGFGDMTYKSLNDHGAYLLGSNITSSHVRLNLGSATTSTLKFEGFKAANLWYYGYSATTYTYNKIKQIDTVYAGRNSLGLFYLASASNLHQIANSTFVVNYSGGDRVFNQASATTVNNCSFVINCSSVPANGITGNNPPNTIKNTIFMSDNSSAINDSAIVVSNTTNCCIYQMHTNDSSGGTDNIFADPQFVDSANGDLRLRPTSPCIGAGTAS